MLALIAILLPLLGLGSWPLLDPDESRTAEVGREILERGDWVVPHINGVPRLDKPILTYAAMAVSLDLFGMTPFAARLPAYLALAASALLAGFGFRRELGPDGAGVACLMTASAPLVGVTIRSGTIDSILTFWTTLAIVLFWRAFTSGRSIGWTVLAWVAIGCGVLTKGPVALLIPFAAAFPAALKLGRIRALLSPAGIGAMILVVYPWVAAVQSRHTEFLSYVIRTETIERTTSDLQRTGPIWLPLIALLVGALPWSLPLLAAAWRFVRRRTPLAQLDAMDLMLAGWIILPLIVFTLSQSRRPQYVLPLIPAVAIALTRLWQREPGLGRRGATVACASFALLLAIALPVTMSRTDLPAHVLALAALGGGAMWTLAALLIRGADTLRRIAFAAFALMFFLITFLPLIGLQAEAQSGAATAAEIRRLGVETDHLIGLHTYSPSVGFELGTTYRLVTHHGRELGGNYIAGRYGQLVDNEDSPLRSRGWFEQHASACAEPMVLLVRTDDRSTLRDLAERRAHKLAETRRFSLWDPCPH